MVRTGCFGLCAMGPIVIVYPEGAFYSHIKRGGRGRDRQRAPASRAASSQHLLYKEAVEERRRYHVFGRDVDFYKKQKRVALRNCGVIDPENIDEYIACDGYQALAKVLTEMTPRGGHRDHARIPACAAAAAQASPRA